MLLYDIHSANPESVFLIQMRQFLLASAALVCMAVGASAIDVTQSRQLVVAAARFTDTSYLDQGATFGSRLDSSMRRPLKWQGLLASVTPALLPQPASCRQSFAAASLARSPLRLPGRDVAVML